MDTLMKTKLYVKYHIYTEYNMNMSYNILFQKYISKQVANTTLRMFHTLSSPSVLKQRCVNTRLDVTLLFRHRCLYQMHLSVREFDFA